MELRYFVIFCERKTLICQSILAINIIINISAGLDDLLRLLLVDSEDAKWSVFTKLLLLLDSFYKTRV